MEADKPATDSMFFACAMIFLVATVMASGWGAHLVWGGLCALYTLGGLIARQRARRQEAQAQVRAELAVAAAAASAAAAAVVAPLAAVAAPSFSLTRAVPAGVMHPVAANTARRAPAVFG
ncbi:hypothetical protein [Pseudoduganella violacea]|uniref:Uncharacterized protein n=1 Tax=Pseudoduganella violacea TaxID=1715466 RepID=A0A7W5BE01_9BURK|nr:hypothetical protein [Pseudoduganella violacea]MBB3121482.1 hypothetical protein [Pseudoduganella violacea]